MRRVIIALMILSVPCMIFLSIYRVYTYQQLEAKVELLKEEQSDLFERNKRMIANIAIVSSPERIEEIAKQELELSRIQPERKLRITVKKERERERSQDG